MERYPYQGRFNDYPFGEYTQAGGSTPTWEQVDDIVCALPKGRDVPVDHRLNCYGVATRSEQKHGQWYVVDPV